MGKNKNKSGNRNNDGQGFDSFTSANDGANKQNKKNDKSNGK